MAHLSQKTADPLRGWRRTLRSKAKDRRQVHRAGQLLWGWKAVQPVLRLYAKRRFRRYV